MSVLNEMVLKSFLRIQCNKRGASETSGVGITLVEVVAVGLVEEELVFRAPEVPKVAEFTAHVHSAT